MNNQKRIACLFSACLVIMLSCLVPSTGLAQGTDAIIANPEAIASVMNDAPTQQAGKSVGPSGIDLRTLIFRGGAFMIPIGLMSLLVVTLAVERSLSMRQSKVVPRGMVSEIRALASDTDRFQPDEAFHICSRFPSAASRVLKAMFLRTGQPVGEIEKAATETAQREADRYAAPIRWLNLAAAATPLMGLLGTVWGMIVAFHESTTLTPDRSRSEQLSEGIYTALVTTLAGLVVAIPAAILAQYLENRLAKLFGRAEQLAFDVAPGLARFVGRQRMDRDGELHWIHRNDPHEGEGNLESNGEGSGIHDDGQLPSTGGSTAAVRKSPRSKASGTGQGGGTPKSRPGRDGLQAR